MLQFNDKNNLVAYFSMEIGFKSEIPTYSGGLGILAGDTLRSLADLGVPAVAITMLSEYGYFTQEITDDNQQHERFTRWEVEKYLQKLDQEVIVPINNQDVHVYLWKYEVEGYKTEKVPIIFLDTNHPNNPNEYRKLTQRLYPTNKVFRLEQEILLGVGGIKALNALEYFPTVYHMNEGHPAFLTLELLRQLQDAHIADPLPVVRNLCVFTTHTPVPAGHDRFQRSIVKEKLGSYYDLIAEMPDVFDAQEQLNMSYLAAHLSEKINGVAKKHAEVSRSLFPNYPISSITNGVHHVYWASESFKRLFDQKIPGWREDPFTLLNILRTPNEKISEAHQENKSTLIAYIKEKTGIQFSEEVFTIGYARRITKYKRPDLLFYDLQKLNEIAEKMPLQIVYAGKAHYEDIVGKSLIHEVLNLSKKVSKNIKIVFLPNYRIDLAKIIIPGVDIWLNTPMRPLEASGTSGMKASLNGVPNFSVLDGWWIEGAIEGVTGWSIGKYPEHETASMQNQGIDCDDSESLYQKLSEIILPMYYQDRKTYETIRKNCVALHGSHFNTHRMVQQYIVKSYLT